jgi:hypothetical protein
LTGLAVGKAGDRAISGFESLGEKEVSFYRGVLSGRPEALDRVRERAGFAHLFKLKLGGRVQKGGDKVLHVLI